MGGRVPQDWSALAEQQERRTVMKFQYYEKDPMDEVPAPPVKMGLSLAGITLLFLVILYGTAFILGFRF